MTTAKQRGMPYSEQLQDARWHAFRGRMVAKVGGVCEDCLKQKAEWLTVHHCYYVSGLAIWEHPEELCMVLCWDCHQARQRFEEAAHVAITKALRNEPVELLEPITWRLLEAAADHARRQE